MVMTLLEYLDRVGERRAAKRPRDIRQFIGFAFLLGYYIMVYRFSQQGLPQENIDLIRDAMLTLGPPIGIIIGAMFRSDAREEQATVNTGKMAEAVVAAAKAGTPAHAAADGADEAAGAATDRAAEIREEGRS
jgi:hypothetical protein